MHSFETLAYEKYRDLETRVKGHSRSLAWHYSIDRIWLHFTFFSNFGASLYHFRSEILRLSATLTEASHGLSKNREAVICLWRISARCHDQAGDRRNLTFYAWLTLNYAAKWPWATKTCWQFWSYPCDWLESDDLVLIIASVHCCKKTVLALQKGGACRKWFCWGWYPSNCRNICRWKLESWTTVW